jgi:hypothetical protein
VKQGSRGQGFKESSEMLKNYKELKVWQKAYQQQGRFRKSPKANWRC